MPKPLDRRIRNREYDAKRKQQQPWRVLYKTSHWQALRAAQLSKHPLCERCLARDKLTPATVCHHKIAHKGDTVLFWDSGNLASSCSPCHDIDEQRIERGGKARQVIGADGWPVE